MAMNDYSILLFGAGGIPANENSGTSLPAPRWYSGTAAPTSGNYYNVGDFVWNVSPGATSPGVTKNTLGWACTTAGAGGTAVFTTILTAGNAVATTTTIVTGTLASATRFFALNGATGPNLSLPEASAFLAGEILTIENIGANTATLTPLGTDALINGYTAVTLTQYQSVNLMATGSTNWYSITTPQYSTVISTPVNGNTLANGVRLNVLNPAATGTFSLPEASYNYPGFVMTLNNISANTVTLTPLGTDQYQGGLNITLAQNAVVSIIAAGSTNWYKAA